MAETRSTEAPKIPRSKWVAQLHRAPTRWDILLHKLAESLARRYWYNQVHFRQEILRLDPDELWDAAMQMSRAFGKQTILAAASGRESVFALAPGNLERLVEIAAQSALSAVINYLEIAHNCFLKRNHPDLELLAPRIAETFRRFFTDKLSVAAELRPCLEDPAASDEGYFPAAQSSPAPSPKPADPAAAAYRLGVIVNDDDDARALLRKLVDFVKSDPMLAPEFAVEMVTKLAARQLHAAKSKGKVDQVVEAAHIRDRFLFSPCRQSGLLPVRLFLDQQLFASAQQKQRLHRWETENIDGIFRVTGSSADTVALHELSSGRDYTVQRDPLLSQLSGATLIRARLLPWDDQWLISGAVQVIDPASANEDALKEMLHPLRVRRLADENDPRLLAARRHVTTVHAQFVKRFEKDLAIFPTLDACRSALSDFHHHLLITLLLPDGRQFADAWQQDTGIEFPPFLAEQFAADETTVTTPGILYDPEGGMAFLPSAEEVSYAMTSPFPSVEQKQAFARLLLEKWRPGWIIRRLAAEYPLRVQEIIRELLGDSHFALANDLEPLLGRVKCPDHTLPARPIPFLVS